jgi:hypothetical protein
VGCVKAIDHIASSAGATPINRSRRVSQSALLPHGSTDALRCSWSQAPIASGSSHTSEAAPNPTNRCRPGSK